jgi:(S)-ureidoglycine aminohydrolase
MKIILLVFVILGIFANEANSKIVESKVYSYAQAKIKKTASGEKRELISGATTHLAKFEIIASILPTGKARQEKRTHSDCEEIIFIREGELKISIGDASKTMVAGSVALIMPGDELMLENAGKSNATYYLIQYKSNRPVNLWRGKNAGGSMLLNWDSIQFTPHDKGGIRRFFDRKSAMSERIEMHATTLKPGIKSHDPHTHLPDEILIMMEGTTEMEIGNGKFSGQPGDVYFMGSNIPHAIRNTGDKACMYLAFQWE